MMMHAGCGKHPDALMPVQGTKDSLLVYIMAGQSNMAGRGLIEPQDTVTDLRILTIDSAGELVIAKEPLHFYHPGFSGLDCGVSFAKDLLSYAPPGSKICLVPCAMSSTSVQEWLGDSSHGVKLYTNMITRAQIAMQRGVLRGVLWHQGESNAEDSARAANYDDDLGAFIQKIRKDVHVYGLPFFAATLADFCARPFKDQINAEIRSASDKLTGLYVISTADLSCRPDNVHFDAAGQREMGRRFARVAGPLLR
jgi:hypothetical protein